MVQKSALSSRELQLVITNLVQVFKTDPDLALLEQVKISEIMPTVYAVSGCDWIGKATFLLYCRIITSLKYSRNPSRYKYGQQLRIGIPGIFQACGRHLSQNIEHRF